MSLPAFRLWLRFVHRLKLGHLVRGCKPVMATMATNAPFGFET
jgi:hypothetical protein